MTLSGNIETFSFAAIGGLIHSEKKTGVLKVIQGNHCAGIYFKNGNIVFITSDLTRDVPLGALLMNHQLVQEEDIREALALSKESGKRLGVVLIERGAISQKKLIGMLHYQFKEVMARVLGWNEGEFEYSDGITDYVEDIHFEIDPIRLIADARKWREYRRAIPNDEVVFRIVNDRLPQTDDFSSHTLSRVMLMIDGNRSVSRIITETGLSRLAVYRALAALVSHGAISGTGMDAGFDFQEKGDRFTQIDFYHVLFDEMTRGLSEELGSKKVAFLLRRCLVHVPGGDRLFYGLPVDVDLKTTRQMMHDGLRERGEQMPRNDMMHSLNRLVLNLLQEEYRLLGFRSAKNTVHRLISILDGLPHDRKHPFQDLIWALDLCTQDEGLLDGTRDMPDKGAADRTPMRGRPISDRNPPNGIERDAVTAFYGHVILVVLKDLEKEIGLKGVDLFNDILKRFKYSKTFLPPCDTRSDLDTNIMRIQEFLRARSHSSDLNQWMFECRHILVSLIQEENRLLGEKATRSTISKIKGAVTAPEQRAYQSLADPLLPILENIIGHRGN